jgi:hypothetical protein
MLFPLSNAKLGRDFDLGASLPLICLGSGVAERLREVGARTGELDSSRSS